MNEYQLLKVVPDTLYFSKEKLLEKWGTQKKKRKKNF